MKKLRFRHIYTIIGSLIVLLAWLGTDPDLGLISGLPFGASTLAMIVILSKSVLYVALLHYSRKALLDYLDLKTLLVKASESSQGAGLAMIAVAGIMISISLVILASVTS